jgi:EAL domain-containing protein (putative c-di-GMP-specific phosphodiesterase class I)
MGYWVLQEACGQMQDWRTRYHLDHRLRMSINLSGEQLNQPDLVDRIQTSLQQSGLPPVSLSLEVTESALIKDVDTTISALSKLKEIGVSLQLDDFGTGYSSLSYLRQFPIDVLKIDRSFILNKPLDERAPDLVRTIVLMGQELGLDVIAEGIETNEQAQRLNNMGCSQGQGFLFSKAVDAGSAERFLDAAWSQELRASQLDRIQGISAPPYGWDFAWPESGSIIRTDESTTSKSDPVT